MGIDVARAVGAELVGTSYAWSEEDVILYNLAVGAGDPPDDQTELRYAYESDLTAVPTFGTIPPFSMMMSLGEVDGIDIDLTRVLHGDQTLTVHSPIPTSGMVRQTGTVVDVFDRVRGALIVLEVVSSLEGSGEAIFTNRSGIYVRGEGGFGGDRGPKTANVTPERPPDHVVETTTLPQQALLYRMASGDKNPLHADPAFAAMAGFDRPILHGLCTYGIVAKTVIDTALDGGTESVAGYEARFSGHVFPGETLVTRIWEEQGRLLFTSDVADRGASALSNGALTLR
jgi:acyl dehydratase